MGEDEVLAVLGHEIGHEKRKHILKRTIGSAAFSFVGFYALSLLARWPELYAAFGFVRDGSPGPTKEALLLIFALVSGPATFFLTPLASAWSRKHEFEADRFAVAAVNALSSGGPSGAESLSSALIRLNNDNASNLWPHPLYSFWYYSHPTLAERLRALRRNRREGGESS
jgi:STE24 endopeptidase